MYGSVGGLGGQPPKPTRRRHAAVGGTRTDENAPRFLVAWRYASRGPHAEMKLVLRARVSAWRRASREPEPVAQRRRSRRPRSTSSRMAPPRDAVPARGPLGRPSG